MKRTRLLPCPFCGKKPSLTNERMSNHRFLVGCYNASCVVTTSTKWFGSAGGAIEAWNQRAALLTAREINSIQAALTSAEAYDIKGEIRRKLERLRRRLSFSRPRARA